MKKLSNVSKTSATEPTGPAEAYLPISNIYTRPQVRKKFKNLDELADSFRLNGIIEPLVVHAEDDGRYRLVVGERRFRAAPLAGLDKVPVVIKRNLSGFEIRALQVAENNNREDLTAFEQALGVIEDVERYGTQEAMKIWNVKSEGWISKRVAVKKYGPKTREILESDLSGDFEVLHCLNQVEALDDKEFGHMRKRLESGLPLSREEVRNTLSRVKAWKKQHEELRRRREDLEKSRRSATASKIPVKMFSQKHSQAVPVGSMESPSHSASANVARGKQLSPGRSALPVVAESSTNVEASERKQLMLQLNSLRNQLHMEGRDKQVLFKNIQQSMTGLEYELSEGEWILWAGFLDTVLPMLHALGRERSRQYLKRLQADLKSRPALEIWEALHAIPQESVEDDESKGIVPVVDMPSGWRF